MHPHQHDDWDEPQHPSMVANPTSWAKRLKRTFIQHWQPKALPVPVVDIELPQLSGIERSAEVLRFMSSKLEHALSPQGTLREFTKLNVRVAFCIAIPALMVAPLVTMALQQLKTWVAMLSETVSSFVLFPLSVVLSIILVAGLIYIGKSLLELRYRYQSRDRYNY